MIDARYHGGPGSTDPDTWTCSGLRDQIPEGIDDGPHGPTLIHAVRDQLGLELISKKGHGDIVVVDHMAKVPSEN